jgi:hypothetical protein
MDLFIVPTIGFDLLYGLVIIRLARRDLVWINVTPHPAAEWIARQARVADRPATFPVCTENLIPAFMTLPRSSV